MVDIDTNSVLMARALQLSCRGHKAAYERLEFLGDRVVGLIVAALLYRTFPREAEGLMARRFVALTREETLAEIAEQIGLPDRLKTPDDKLRHNASILSFVCEAVVAAIYLERGLDAARDFLTPFLIPFLEAEPEAPQDSKSALQEWSQQHYKQLPVYETMGRTGPDHAPTFMVKVSVAEHSAVGEGSSKKIAAQQAAAALLAEVIHEQ